MMRGKKSKVLGLEDDTGTWVGAVVQEKEAHLNASREKEVGHPDRKAGAGWQSRKNRATAEKEKKRKDT